MASNPLGILRLEIIQILLEWGHMYGAFAEMGLIGPVCSTGLARSFLNCTCCFQRGLPVLDYTARSNSRLSEEAQRLITWSGICQAILLNAVTWSKSICLYGLIRFVMGWFTGRYFTIALELCFVYWYCPAHWGFIQAGEKLALSK